ncbi:MAG: serine/threonine protein kinase, partial [Gammaproteobacteria bacterium]
MSGTRAAIEGFVAGALDYGELQSRLEEAFRQGQNREGALALMDAVADDFGISPALHKLLERAIDRQSGIEGGEHTDTFPDFDDEDDREEDTDHSPKPAVDAPPEDEYEIELGPVFDEPVDEEYTEPPRTRPRISALEPDEIELKDIELSGEDDNEPADDLPPIFASGKAEEKKTEPEPGIGKAPEPGTVLADRYVLQSILGRGGMGIVYRALDRRRQEAGTKPAFVALKVLRPELQVRVKARHRLLAEAVQGQLLRHPNIVTVHDFGREGDIVFVTMEPLEGERLRSLMVRRAPAGLDRPQALSILRGIGEAVAYLHVEGYVHRDLKPGNVFLTRDGKTKLLDFGLARRLPEAGGGSDRSGEEFHARTPAYASPQVLRNGPPDTRDDVYALGCIAYEILSGKHPFDKLAADEAERRKMKPAVVPGLSPQQRKTLVSALSFRAKKRPQNAGEFLAGMELLDAQPRRFMPGFMQGVLAGIAIGVFLALLAIHPDGPASRLVGPSAPGVVTPADQDEAGDDGRAEVDPSTSKTMDGDATTEPQAIFSPAPEQPELQEAEDTAEVILNEDSIPDADEEIVDVGSGTSSPEPEPSPPALPGRLSFARSLYRTSEGSAVLIAEVVRQEGAAGRVTVRWRTVSDSALAEDDFAASDWQVLALEDGQASGRIFIPLVDDGRREQQESFFIQLADPQGGA